MIFLRLITLNQCIFYVYQFFRLSQHPQSLHSLIYCIKTHRSEFLPVRYTVVLFFIFYVYDF
ncbi:hypothetical protein BDF20DRAFT_854224 [Mycotypha africana]|uniref:uncharacterized protein n=1 Tax=Mycotypha africana TaxID=64632 RepID=UPI002301F031|nr:uncharacterized protein BDF20DRAFT_854224 [Mycotypha africana]KAI8988164.1 hypothetical protein BDF20DRAFT_854224 [Mycotypha africana]